VIGFKPTGKNLIKELLNPEVYKITIYARKAPSDEFVDFVCKNYGFEVHYRRFIAFDGNVEGLDPGYWEKITLERST